MPGFSSLFMTLFAVTLSEVYLFAVIGGRIGALATVALVFVTAAVGAGLMRQQGMSVLRRAQENMSRGVPPAKELVDGLLILAAGLVLVTPGFLTDAVGFFLLFPPGRALIRAWLINRYRGQLTMRGGMPGMGFQEPYQGQSGAPRASQLEILEPPADDDAPEDET